MTQADAHFRRRARYGIVRRLLEVRDLRQANTHLARYEVSGALPDDLVAILVLTRDDRGNLVSRNPLRVRINKELHKVFSKAEIELLIGDM